MSYEADTYRQFVMPRCRKFYFTGGQVEIAAELVHELDADGKQLRVLKLTDYTAEKVRTLCPSWDELPARWSDSRPAHRHHRTTRKQTNTTIHE